MLLNEDDNRLIWDILKTYQMELCEDNIYIFLDVFDVVKSELGESTMLAWAVIKMHKIYTNNKTLFEIPNELDINPLELIKQFRLIDDKIKNEMIDEGATLLS
jgi:hypothetical protein